MPTICDIITGMSIYAGSMGIGAIIIFLNVKLLKATEDCENLMINIAVFSFTIILRYVVGFGLLGVFMYLFGD